MSKPQDPRAAATATAPCTTTGHLADKHSAGVTTVPPLGQNMLVRPRILACSGPKAVNSMVGLGRYVDHCSALFGPGHVGFAPIAGFATFHVRRMDGF
jgi:hypothetical protein